MATFVSESPLIQSPRAKERYGPFRAHLRVQAKTIVVVCIDPRFIVAVWNFVTETLGLKSGEFIFLPNPGGGLHFHPESNNGIERAHLYDTIKFAFSEFPHLERVVVISHEQCVAYARTAAHHGTAFCPEGKSVEDLQIDHLAGIALGKPPRVIPRDVRVDAFYLRVVDEMREEVVFEEV